MNDLADPAVVRVNASSAPVVSPTTSVETCSSGSTMQLSDTPSPGIKPAALLIRCDAHLLPKFFNLSETPGPSNDQFLNPFHHARQASASPIFERRTKKEACSAIARWYVDQVIRLLVKPGQYRAGFGGASDEEWGPVGREKDALARRGLAPYDYSESWRSMRAHVRHPETERHDPWNVIYNSQRRPRPTFVTFVCETIQRMAITPTAVVAAVWYLTGLGLHDGDGHKGASLRNFLRNHRWADLEAVERRVSILGLVLAHKWLDENSYLTKQW